MGIATVVEMKPSISGKRYFRPSLSSKHANECSCGDKTPHVQSHNTGKGAINFHVKDSERYLICKAIDCQKLSQEACSHAAQNERLPVQMAVQVLYFEQTRLKNAMNGVGGQNHFLFGSMTGQFPLRSGAGSGCISPRDNYASVRRENRELKLEVARMRMRLTDLEKDHVSIKQDLVKPHPANRLFKAFTKKLSKINSLFRATEKPIDGKASSKSRLVFQKRRCHSIS